MNILLINKFYWPDVGGVETVVQQHANFLTTKGNKVTVLCIKKNASLKTEKINIQGVNIIRCSSLGTFFSMPLSLSFFYHYIRSVLDNKFIIFHEPFPLADIAMCLFLPKKKKTMIFWHSDIVRQKKLKLILGFFIKKALRKANVVCTTSKNLSQHSEYLGIVKEKLQIVPLSIDTDGLNKKVNSLNVNEFDSEIKSYADAQFISFGRLSYYKGLDVLLEALKILKKEGVEPRVVISGKGELSNHIANIIKQEQLSNVIFINRFLKEDEKCFLLKNIKCFLFPSIANSEAFGITQLESLALGTPVINTSLPTGVPDVSINNLTGLTVTPGDPYSLAEAIKKIYLNKVNLEIFSVNAKIRASTIFDDKIVLPHFYNIILDVCNDKYI
ncbi:glycosyltransferase [Escherichia coli]|nr:glycosyltransferase [Escherichia coli]